MIAYVQVRLSVPAATSGPGCDQAELAFGDRPDQAASGQGGGGVGPGCRLRIADSIGSIGLSLKEPL
jgi:hypothetical protein